MNSSTDMIEALFGGHGRVAILRLLARTTAPLTGRQVAELTGLSPAGAARALEWLSELGVIERRRVGRAITHELQRDSIIVQAIVLPALEGERSLRERLERDISQTFGPEALSVVLFGSIARNEATHGSDIDVLVVTEDEAGVARVEGLAAEEGARYFRGYGMPLSVLARTREALRIRAPFVDEALREGITLAGKPLAELVADDGA